MDWKIPPSSLKQKSNSNTSHSCLRHSCLVLELDFAFVIRAEFSNPWFKFSLDSLNPLNHGPSDPHTPRSHQIRTCPKIKLMFKHTILKYHPILLYWTAGLCVLEKMCFCVKMRERVWFLSTWNMPKECVWHMGVLKIRIFVPFQFRKHKKSPPEE